jgi:hypothetical protein
MSANFVFLCIVFSAVLSFLGWAAYQKDGLPGLLSLLKGAFGGVAFIVFLLGVHVVLHCAMETCGDSAFYVVFR